MGPSQGSPPSQCVNVEQMEATAGLEGGMKRFVSPQHQTHGAGDVPVGSCSPAWLWVLAEGHAFQLFPPELPPSCPSPHPWPPQDEKYGVATALWRSQAGGFLVGPVESGRYEERGGAHEAVGPLGARQGTLAAESSSQDRSCSSCWNGSGPSLPSWASQGWPYLELLGTAPHPACLLQASLVLEITTSLLSASP